MYRILLFTSLVLLPFIAYSQSIRDCANIELESARLSCFDNLAESQVSGGLVNATRGSASVSRFRYCVSFS